MRPHRFGVLQVSLCISAVMAISFLPVMHCQKTLKKYIFRGTTACQWGSTSSKFEYILSDNIFMYLILLSTNIQHLGVYNIPFKVLL